MTLDSSSSSFLEIAHVLFMDLVGYSALPMEIQPRLLRELQEVVRGTDEFRRAEAAEELICLPTGDGMALVFFHDPVAPVRCAMEIAQALRSRPSIKLRLGVHSGPVYVVEDINGRRNVSGGGINLAQRVMDCGQVGHILVSDAAADLISQVGDWPLHDLGEFEVKHGQRLHLFNLYTDALGNPASPDRTEGRVAAPVPSSSDTAIRDTQYAAPRPQPTIGRVAMLYKRHAQPDEELLQELETRLRARGFEVFIDRHLAIGVEWAKEIERQVRIADAVIPLISEAAIYSEMLSYELQTAHEAAQQHGGKPRILPVRVRYEGPLPEPLAFILDPLTYALWESPSDTPRLVEELVRAFQAPLLAASPSPSLQFSIAPKELEAVGGAVPLDSPFYIVRTTDDEFLSAIARRDSIVLVKGARQMGKTSLLARGLQQAREAGGAIVQVDFQKINAAYLESVETFLLALAESLADQLDLEVTAQEAWSPHRSPNSNFERYVRREVLARLNAPLFLGLDEVDRLFSCAFSDEVFGLFRSWYNARALDPTGPWSRLTLAIAYATEAHLFIRDLNQSPFNVGTRVVLQDFTYPQVADLNDRYGAPLSGEAEVTRYFRLVGGHPYLVRRGLHEMVVRELNLKALEAQADQEEGPFGDHLRRLLISLAQDEELCEVVRGLLRGQPCPHNESFYRLRSAGVITGDAPTQARLRCQLYATYLERHLL